MNKILFCDFSFTDLSWVFGRAVTFGSAKKASFLCTHHWKGWPLSGILLFALQTCLGLGKVQANLAFALSFDRFITRSQCSHCSNFILRSNLLRFASLCSQSLRERYRKPLAFFMLCFTLFAICSAERYRSPLDFFMLRSLSCGTLSKATGFLHAAICSKTDSKSQEINL